MEPKTWLITDAASGLGQEIAERLLARGDRVAATARHPEALAQSAVRYGDRLWTASLDPTDTPALRRVVDAAFSELGLIDAVVSTTGSGLFGACEELTDDQIAREVSVGLVGPVQLARAVIPRLRGQGGGRIIQVSGMGGPAAAGVSLCHATAQAIEGFYASVAAEVAPFGISVTVVRAGTARTVPGGADSAVAPAVEAYDHNPAGQVRQVMAGEIPAPSPERTADPAKMAQAIIGAGDSTAPPARLTLGSDAYNGTRAALRERLAELEAYRETAFAADAGTAPSG
ncbi:MAG: SDR family oxidoreductase [Nocardiopsaceae bacterium]|nr:SDR family oxidoreductase [Nocardiopsaceae bacterium]